MAGSLLRVNLDRREEMELVKGATIPFSAYSDRFRIRVVYTFRSRNQVVPFASHRTGEFTSKNIFDIFDYLIFFSSLIDIGRPPRSSIATLYSFILSDISLLGSNPFPFMNYTAMLCTFLC